MERRDHTVLPIRRLSWFPTEGGKRNSVLKNTIFIVKNSERQLVGPLHPTSTPTGCPDDVANTAKKTNDHIKSTYIAKKIYVNLCPDNRGSSLTKPTGRQQRPAMEPESQ